MGRRATGTALLLLAWGITASSQAGLSLPVWLRILAALAAITLFPGWAIAARLRREEDRFPVLLLAFAAGHGVVALLVLLLHAAGAPLLWLALPLFLVGLVTALLPKGPGKPDLPSPDALLLLLLAALLFVAFSPRTGFLTDAYDHFGGTRFQVERGDLFPGEYFHADRAHLLDPRKGTNQTVLALASALAGVDPLEARPPFRAFHLFLLLLAFFTFARATLGGRGSAWTAVLFFLLLFRGGPAEEYIHTVGYPGKAGITLYFIAAGLALVVARRGARGPDLLLLGWIAAGCAGVHPFAFLLLPAALFALTAALLLRRSLRPRARSGALLLAAAVAGGLPFALFRYAATYAPANPLHLHPQALLYLPGGLAVIDPITLLETIGLGGCFSFLLLPFLASPEGGWGMGETFLLAASILVLFGIANPFLYPLLEGKLGYLMRRLPLLLPPSILLAAVVRRPWAKPRSVRLWLPALAAAGITLFGFGRSMAGERRPPLLSGSEARPSWEEPLDRVLEALPPAATVLSDPVTGYTLYGRGLVHPVAIPDQHSSPNDPNGAERLAESQRFLYGRLGDGEADELLDRYGVEYVLINGGFSAPFHTYNAFIDPAAFERCRRTIEERPERFEPLLSRDGLHLYRVGEGRAERAGPTPPRREGPPAGPAIDIPLPGRLVLRGARSESGSAAPGEGVWIRSWWEMGEGGPIPLPLHLYVRAYREGEDPEEPLFFGRDPLRKPWAVRRLGGTGDPYPLWREGDRIEERTFFRVPSSAPEGSYRIELTVEPGHFFPVRRLDGLRRGAIRERWAPVDTLEVKR